MQHPAVMFPATGSQPVHVPLCSHKVAAGFPSPADDYIEGRLGCNDMAGHYERK